MTSNAIPRKQLFTASCLALLVTSLSFGIRAGILGKLGTEFHLNGSELGTIAATAFWGFPLAVVIGGFIVDIIGMKRLLEMAFIFHLVGYHSYHNRDRLLDLIYFHFTDRYCQRNR